MTRGLILLSIVVVLASACSAYAANDLTLNLVAPSLDGHSSTASSGSKPHRIASTSVEKKSATVKVGRVGIVQSPSATIFKSKSAVKVYSTVKADTPLAVVREEGNWYGVLMVNGAVGWVARKDVRMIGYDLVARKQDIDDIIRTAVKYIGVPYVYGGTSVQSGMDCSAFVRMVFSQFGINLPRTAREQAEVGESVPFDQLQPGDRLYFACKNPYPDHCGIYAGNGYFIHCSAGRGGVAIDNLSSAFFARSLVAARRS